MPSVLGLLLCSLPFAEDVFLPIEQMEATTAPIFEGAEWTPVTIGETPEETIRWTHARASFELAAGPESGTWALCLGVPGSSCTVAVQGADLPRAEDALAGMPFLESAPTFGLPSSHLRSGLNEISIQFAGEVLGEGFESGSAYLLSPRLAERLFAALRSRPRDYPIANFRSLGSRSEEGSFFDRIAFQCKTFRDRFRTVAHLDLSVLLDGQEVPARELQKRTISSTFPLVSTSSEDPRFQHFHSVHVAFAPLCRETDGFNLSNCVLGELRQIIRGPESFAFTWRIRCLPRSGGRLRFLDLGEIAVVFNQNLALYAEKSRLLGTADQPLGLEIKLDRDEQGAGNRHSLKGPAADYGLIYLDEKAAAGSRSVIDVVERVHRLRDKLQSQTGELSHHFASPVDGGGDRVATTNRVRMAALSAVTGVVRRQFTSEKGRKVSIAVPAEGRAVVGAASYWRSAFCLLHFPEHEKLLVEWLLAAQEEDGAIRADLSGPAGPHEEIETTLYAVLRVMQHFRWTFDGDALNTWLPKLTRALEFVQSFDADGNGRFETFEAAPEPSRFTTGAQISLANLAAHRQLADALYFLGKTEVGSRFSEIADRLSRALFEAGQGGENGAQPWLLTDEEGWTEKAAGILWDVIPEPHRSALAQKLQTAPCPDSSAAIDRRELLVIRSLYSEGIVKEATRRLQWMGEAIDRLESPFQVDAAGWYDAVVFGQIGLRRTDLGSVSLVPRIDVGAALNSPLVLPEGMLSLQMSKPDAQFKRQLTLRNDTDIDLMVELGVPGGFGINGRTTVGELTFSPYQKLIPAGEVWMETVR